MKFIKNSIDSEYLQDTIADTDLEMEMKNCSTKSESIFNGKHPEDIKISDKANVKLELNNRSNGIHRKSGSPMECNGKVNGYYEEEDDFNLVLEDSSEGGESPLKKIDDDTISAPQIVQEIEDLLGITSNSAVIQEELSNMDGTESIEDNLENVEVIEDGQNIKEILENIDENKLEGRELNDRKLEKDDKEKPVKNTGVIECDTSSNMNLVCNEVEIGMENRDSGSPNESDLPSKLHSAECKIASTTETVSEKESVSSDLTDIGSCDKVNDSQNEKNENFDHSSERDEVPVTLTQSSGVSDNSEDWMVVDTVETSDDDNNSETVKSSTTIINSSTDVLTERPSKTEGIACKTDSSHTISSVSTAVENTPNLISSDLKESKSDADCPHSVSDVKVADLSESLKTTSSCSISSEGDGARKRCAAVDEEDIELKKPKLEDKICLVENSTILKRSSSIVTENESKRSKLGSPEEHQVVNNGDLQEKGGCDTVVNENKISVRLNESSTESIDNDLQVQTSDGDVSKSEKNCSEIYNTNKLDNVKSEVLAKTNNSRSVNHDVSELTETAEQSMEKSTVDTLMKGDSLLSEINPQSLTESSSSSEVMTIQTQQSNEVLAISEKSSCIEPENKVKSVGDGNKENLNDNTNPAKEEFGFKLDDLTSDTKEVQEPPKSDLNKEVVSSLTKTENSKPELPGRALISKEFSSSIKQLEKSIIDRGLNKTQPSKDLKNTEPKKMSNLDFAIERVVEKARIQTEKKVPILQKFHKDQLKKLKRSELEDIVVSKICEAVTYKSEIGQMRLRTQNLEETNEMWRKKVQQIEKQNRELEMVLKRFLAELSHIKRENQDKVPMPIKVTRSVGLQVVLASSMHGALVSSRNKINNDAAHQQQQVGRARHIEKEKVKEPVKSSTFIPPSQSSLGKSRGRPPKAPSIQTSRPSASQTYTPKVTPPTTPSKPNTVTPVKTIQNPNKDLEVIDLTDKEERAKSTSQHPAGGQIRVAPSTQVCFVQQNTVQPSSPAQPLYLVQKTGQRPQFLVATTSASPQRPVNNMSRPPPALALPVFRASGHLIPVQTTGIKTSNNTSPPAITRQVPPSLRIQPQAPVTKHPAPLPVAPVAISKPGMKAPPPKPQLKIAKTTNGIMLSWSMSLTKEMAEMQSYQLYAYQEGNQPPSTGLWKKVGDVKALPLPMACTLTQFIEGHKYHFAVRAVDVHARIGPFSTPSSILLTK